ncbi:MAG TPA: DUF4058 family protein [Tepidisphaeraceae bacterium]|nr:DUF4058 family protein [Tepidisphaeraceae bacterium]
MPIHDWTRVDSGTFHDFHQRWTVTLSNALNERILPPGYFAMVEQRVGGPIADVLTLELALPAGTTEEEPGGGLAVATSPPRAQMTRRADFEVYAGRASRIMVRHRHGKVVAVVEIVSPGNKHSSAEFRAFVEKSSDLICAGVHMMVIDLFPPTPRDPGGMASAIWNQFDNEPMELPPAKPLTISSYDAGFERAMYLSFAEVGDVLPDAPLFLRPEIYVNAPLETSYQEAWRSFPAPLKALVERVHGDVSIK